MPNSIRVACIQPSSTQNMEENISVVSEMILDVASKGAKFIATPENVALMEHCVDSLIEQSGTLKDHPAISIFADLAIRTKTYILIGSLALKSKGRKLLNCSILIDSNGNIIGNYNKIHLFDVTLSSGEIYNESDLYKNGDKAVVVDLPWGKIGMTICYDLRFPSLYSLLANAGAQVITIPAAFTRFTGKDHWHVLVRARAIESGCFIVAPGMWGQHSGGRSTYGHSLIVDPWGKVLADAGEGVRSIIADINLNTVSRVRLELPTLKHEKKYRLL
tara:strand:+ start:1974 stop:2798 length:825 start_codon:yes stop_codon:yes gene_type:complete